MKIFLKIFSKTIILSDRNLSILLLIIASLAISFGGLIMRNINNADAWQISFFRSLGFIFSISTLLFYKYRFTILKNILNVGGMGFLGGFLLMIAHLLFIFSFYKTTIANTLFTMSSIPFITIILSSIFLKEKISFRTFL